MDFDDCYAVHYPRLVRSLELAGIDEADAKDIAQDAFVITLQNWWRVRNGSNPGGYAYRVAFTSLKKRRPMIFAHDAIEVPEPEVDVTEQLTIADALSKLPDRRRSVAILGLVLGFRSAEIAEMLGMSDATARKHLEEARRDLRKWLSQEAADTD
jgi:RNA polymerase sigma-70 factor, ECF subfamily